MIRRRILPLLLLVGLGATALVPLSAEADGHERSVSRIDYPGSGIVVARGSGDQRKLRGTPRSLKRFVKARLDVLFEEAGSKPRCASSPTVVVDRYDSRGWTKVGEGWYAPCPAGGYAAFYDKTSSGWRQILGAQDVRYCEDLAWYGVPRFIAGARCITEDLSPVRYRTHDDVRVSPESAARRAITVSSPAPIVPAEDVITPAALAQQQALVDRGAYLTPEDCTSAAEGGPLAVHLGGSPYGCEVTATYRNDRSERFVMRINADYVVTEVVAIA